MCLWDILEYIQYLRDISKAFTTAGIGVWGFFPIYGFSLSPRRKGVTHIIAQQRISIAKPQCSFFVTFCCIAIEQFRKKDKHLFFYHSSFLCRLWSLYIEMFTSVESPIHHGISAFPSFLALSI